MADCKGVLLAAIYYVPSLAWFGVYANTQLMGLDGKQSDTPWWLLKRPVSLSCSMGMDDGMTWWSAAIEVDTEMEKMDSLHGWKVVQ